MAYRKRRVKFNKNFSIKRVVTKLIVTLIVLWVGGELLSAVGSVMNGTSSPFYQGLTIIGWTVDATNTITATTGSGILTVVGIVGLASIVLEFVQFQF